MRWFYNISGDIEWSPLAVAVATASTALGMGGFIMLMVWTAEGGARLGAVLVGMLLTAAFGAHRLHAEWIKAHEDE